MADNSYAQLIDDYENGILVEPGETLTQYIDRMGGVDYKADGGSIGIEVLFTEKKADGGRVGLFMGGDPLTGQALSIYNSMNSYGFTDQQIADALSAQGLYGSGSTPASDTPVTNTATNIINQGGDGGNNSNTLQSFRQDPSVMPAFEALQRNQQLTSMGINDPFANEASLSGAYYDDMPEDTSNQVGVYQPGIIENIKNKIGGTKIGSMFTGAADKLTNNKLTNTLGNAASTLGNAASFMMNPIFGGAKMLASGLNSILPTNQRAINENIAANLGIGVDNIGRIQGDYGTVGGVMSGYNLSQVTDKTFTDRIDTIGNTLQDKYGLSKEQVQGLVDGTLSEEEMAEINELGFNKTMGTTTNLITQIRNVKLAQDNIMNQKSIAAQMAKQQREAKAAADALAIQQSGLTDLGNIQMIQQYTGKPLSDYRMSVPASQRNYTGGDTNPNPSTPGAQDSFSNKSGMGRTGYGDGGLATMFKEKR